MNSQLRSKFISEAYKLFIIKGIKDTSFADILISMQKSKGALTYYFPTKEELICSVIDTCFFPASQIPAEWYVLSKNNFIFLERMYRNPIERVMCNFSFLVDNNKFIAYMQFVASAYEYVGDFNVNYKKLWEQEYIFLEGVIQNAVTRGELSVTDIALYQKYFLELSIGQSFSACLI